MAGPQGLRKAERSFIPWDWPDPAVPITSLFMPSCRNALGHFQGRESKLFFFNNWDSPVLQEALVRFQRFRRGDPLMLGWENLSGSAHVTG